MSFFPCLKWPIRAILATKHYSTQLGTSPDAKELGTIIGDFLVARYSFRALVSFLLNLLYSTRGCRMNRFSLIAACLLYISFSIGCSLAAIGASAYTQTQVILVQEKMIAKDRGVIFDLLYNPKSQMDEQSGDTEADVIVKVNFVRPQSDAAKAGLQKGDEIILINGEAPSSSNNIINLFFDRYDNPIVIKVKRNKTDFVTKLMPL